jgi:hypothetical protein
LYFSPNNISFGYFEEWNETVSPINTAPTAPDNLPNTNHTWAILEINPDRCDDTPVTTSLIYRKVDKIMSIPINQKSERWVGSEEMRNAYQILAGKPQEEVCLEM